MCSVSFILNTSIPFILFFWSALNATAPNTFAFVLSPAEEFVKEAAEVTVISVLLGEGCRLSGGCD